MSCLYPFAKEFLSKWWQEGFRESEKGISFACTKHISSPCPISIK
ncbi:hypothetical protein OE903_15540 [Bacillus sp. B6(2022)]|nr:hypothetical protein [Bacillus sp. B6(2022)]